MLSKQGVRGAIAMSEARAAALAADQAAAPLG